jgi:hypothetical protein
VKSFGDRLGRGCHEFLLPFDGCFQRVAQPAF